MKAINATAQINFRVEGYIKREAEVILNGIGISMSSALSIFLKQVVARRAIPMELKYDPLTDPHRIEQARLDYENGHQNYHFHEIPPLPAEKSTTPAKARKSARHAKALV